MAHCFWRLGNPGDNNGGVSVTLTDGRWDCSCVRNEDVERGKNVLHDVCKKHMKNWKHFENYKASCTCEYFQCFHRIQRCQCLKSTFALLEACSQHITFQKRRWAKSSNTLFVLGKRLWMEFNKMKGFPRSISFFLII